MRQRIRPASTRALLAAACFFCAAGAAQSAPKLLGSGCLPGTAADLSGLTDTLEDGSAHNRLGGFGSGIDYTGTGNLYVAVPDRGPADGTTHWIDRIDTFEIEVTPAGVVTPKLTQTRLLTDEKGAYFTGAAAAFDAGNPAASLRFDPEGVRVAKNGNLFISDEYGPFLYEFSPDGKRLRSLPVPQKFLIAQPNADGTKELPPGNTTGRQSNRGMEGLALAPGSGKLYGIMQSPLIQDGGLDAANKRVGTNNRILEIDPATGATREFLYPMEAAGYGVSEIVAVNDHVFLVDERDGKAGADAAFKRIYAIDLAGATDISSMTLPATGVPNGVTAVTKRLFMDLLDPSYNLAGASFPEKIEGLAFGPDLPDGRHLLLVTNDNDLSAQNPSCIYAFAIDPADLPNFQR